MTMQHKQLRGSRVACREVSAEHLVGAERDRVLEARKKAQRAKTASENLLAMAKCTRLGFAERARWLVGTCKVGLEQTICEELNGLQIEAWCPVERLVRRPRRGLKAVEIESPFFRGYVFIRVIPDNEAFVGVLAASRVRSLMGSEGRPALMPERLMEMLMLQTKKGQHKQEHDRVLPVKVGDGIVVRSGPFSDFHATVRRIADARWKLTAEVNMFGRMTLVELDIDSVEACS